MYNIIQTIIDNFCSYIAIQLKLIIKLGETRVNMPHTSYSLVQLDSSMAQSKSHIKTLIT